jgi:hypothetical protein
MRIRFPDACSCFAAAAGLRNETTINNTKDLYVGKSLHKLPALRVIGFQANRRRSWKRNASRRIAFSPKRPSSNLIVPTS